MRHFLCASLLLFPTLAAAAESAPAPERKTKGNLVMEGLPDIPADVAERLLQYQNTRSANLIDISPDGDGLLMTTRFAETTQLHWIKRPGGDRRQLTFFKEPVGDTALSPKPGARELVYAIDEGGSENYQLYAFRLADAKPRLLTDGKSRNENPLWSRDGGKLLFNGTARNGKDFDFYLLEAGGKPKLLAQVEGQWFGHEWSPDGSKVLVQRYVSINESYLHVLDAKTGTLTPLLTPPAGTKVAYGAARWAGPTRVLFTSDESGEFVRLGLLDLPTQKVTWLSADIPWNVEELAVSQDGKRAAFVANEDGYGALYIGPAAGPFKPAPKIPKGLIYSLRFSRAGNTLGFVANTPTSPGDIYSLAQGAAAPVRWTESETGGLPQSAFVEPELVRFPTFDQAGGSPRTIPAFYYKPRGAGPFPVVVSIHGGPESQERPWFSPIYQYYANELGLAVLAPNVRGSDGYGKSYLLLDNGFKREDSVKDIGALLDWIATRPELDKERVGVSGGSYGGYMSLASLARLGDRLKAGVDVVGISNFVTFLKNTKDYRRDLRRAEYGDERDPAMEKHLQEISPNNLASKIADPLFVIQGQNDPRVPASEAEQIVQAVRTAGRPVWYLNALDEGHGFSKKSNRDFMQQAVSVFWRDHLIGK